MKKFWLVMAALSLVGVMAAAPASAHSTRIDGDIYLKYLGPACEAGGGARSWVGTVQIDGETYGWADFGISFEEYYDGRFAVFEEYWTIFATEADHHITGPDDVSDLGVLDVESCDPTLVLIDGYNVGWGWMPNGNALGRVENVDPGGPFADVRDGAVMFWRGQVTEFGEFGPTDFVARLFIR